MKSQRKASAELIARYHNLLKQVYLWKIKRRYQNRASTNLGRSETIQQPVNVTGTASSEAYHQKTGGSYYAMQETRDELREKLQQLTFNPSWNWPTFREVLICLGKLGEYFPARRRPDRISLDGLQSTFTELRHLSAQHQGRETSRVIFVDRERRNLVISGKTHIGTQSKVKIFDQGIWPGICSNADPDGACTPEYR